MVQLAVDEGLDSGKAAAAKLREMASNRASYKHAGYSALFMVICGLGDKEQAGVVKRFMDDPHPWITHYARIVYPRFADGDKHQFAAGY
jgi:hypothetical protein